MHMYLGGNEEMISCGTPQWFVIYSSPTGKHSDVMSRTVQNIIRGVL